MNKFLAVGISCALAGSLAFTAVAQTHPAKTEVGLAHAHSAMAQQADTLKMAHAHLQHVINCLVGPKGKAFDANALNPCKGHGNGAIPDASGNAALHAKLEKALSAAKAGLAATSLDAAHSDAAKAAAALQATPTQKASGGYSW